MRTKGGVSRSRKRDLNQPDEFITTSSRMMEFFFDHRQSLVMALVALILIGSGGYLYYFFSERREAEAFRLLSEAQNKYQQAAQEDKTKAYEAAVTDFTKIMNDFSRTVGGNIARLTLANINYETERFDEAIPLYQQALSKFKPQDYLTGYLLSNLGYAYLQKNNYEEALKYFEQLKNFDSKALKADAYFNLGIIYELAGNLPKSKEAFKTIVDEFADSAYIEIAKKKIAG